MNGFEQITSEDGEIMLYIGQSNTVGASPRLSIVAHDPETGAPYLAAHLPCECMATRCLGIVHWFRLADHTTGLRLLGTGMHTDIELEATSIGGFAIEIIDSSPLDIIDEREDDDDFWVPIPDDQKNVLSRLRSLPNVKKWLADHPTEGE